MSTPDELKARLEGTTVARTAPLKLSPKPAAKGPFGPELKVAKSVEDSLIKARDTLSSRGFQNLPEAEVSMAEIKELQVSYTNVQNRLSEIRKLIASDLSRLRQEAKRAKSSGGGSGP